MPYKRKKGHGRHHVMAQVHLKNRYGTSYGLLCRGSQAAQSGTTVAKQQSVPTVLLRRSVEGGKVSASCASA